MKKLFIASLLSLTALFAGCSEVPSDYYVESFKSEFVLDTLKACNGNGGSTWVSFYYDGSKRKSSTTCSDGAKFYFDGTTKTKSGLKISDKDIEEVTGYGDVPAL